MHDDYRKIQPGQQLSLNLPEVATIKQSDTFEAFAREKRAAELLRELARALGEQRAAIDLEDYCRSLVIP
jgi:hypothetical protein